MFQLSHLLAIVAPLVFTSLAGAEVWTLGVWNVENLSPTVKRGFPELKGNAQLLPRTNNQLREIANYLRDDLQVDAIMISEVFQTSPTGSVPRNSQLDTIVGELGTMWKYEMGETGEKSVAFVFNADRISIKAIAEFSVEDFTIQHKDIFHRDPLVVWIGVLDDQGTEVDDLLLIGLHLKSQQKFRDNHMVAVAKLVTELDQFKKDNGVAEGEKDVIILGDLNDSAHRRRDFHYLFDYLDDKRFVHLRSDDGNYPDTRINGSEIDHIFIADHLEFDWIDPETFQVHTVSEQDRPQYRKTFSDHFPLTFDFEFPTDEQ